MNLQRIVVTILSLAAISAATMASDASTASAASVAPCHRPGAALTRSQIDPYFLRRMIDVETPRALCSFSGTVEYVLWRTDLYRWNGSSWILYDSSMPWDYTQANYTAWNGVWQTTSGAYATDQIFYPKDPGYYRALQYFYWSSSNTLQPEYTKYYDGVAQGYSNYLR
jgi:hypothetical protein